MGMSFFFRPGLNQLLTASVGAYAYRVRVVVRPTNMTHLTDTLPLRLVV